MNRIVRGSPGTLSMVYTVNDVPTDLDAPPTLSVTRIDGSVAASGTSNRTDLGSYAYTLPPESQLSPLTVTWSGLLSTVAVSVETYAEIVGGEYFSIQELRDYDAVLQNTTKYTTAKLQAARLNAESDIEGLCNRAFVPRGYRENLVGNGTCSLWLSRPDPIRLFALTVNGEDWSDRTFTRPDDNLRVINLDSGVWPSCSKIVIYYEYGTLTPPVRIANAAKKLAKYRVVGDQSRIDERATVMTIPDFGTFSLATPGIQAASLTGIPEVDIVLWDYALERT